MLIVREPARLGGRYKTHPWSKTSYSEDGGAYYDFCEHPELIPEVLEDFRPYADREAVQVFYRFLAWVNGDDSLLETADCAMRPPHENNDTLFRARLKIDGRLEIFCREYKKNVVIDYFEWFEKMFVLYFQIYRPDFHRGIVSVNSHPTDYIRLVGEQCRGQRLCLTFNAYGDSEAETFESLLVVFDGIWEAFKRTDAAMKVAVPDFP